jgi:hypothetical protein
MPEPQTELEPFAVRDCALVVVATGTSATTLRELRDALLAVDESSIYHHFWGRLLEPQFSEPEFNNDFASWVYRSLNDKLLAERLSVIDPTDYLRMEDLRAELVDLIEARLDEGDPVTRNQSLDPLHLTRSQMVVFDTGQAANTPAELARLLPELHPGSIFYHFIDARRRTEERRDDFSAWLARGGPVYQPAIDRLTAIDPYFSSLARTQQVLTEALGALGVA